MKPIYCCDDPDFKSEIIDINGDYITTFLKCNNCGREFNINSEIVEVDVYN